MRRDRRTPLEDQANVVERLAQMAFSQVTGGERKRLLYNLFFRSINDPDLQRYWLVAKVSSLEEALKMDKAYFQVDGSWGAVSLRTRWPKKTKGSPHFLLYGCQQQQPSHRSKRS